jgi:capsular exopolysaccharide synthesis family protein
MADSGEPPDLERGPSSTGSRRGGVAVDDAKADSDSQILGLARGGGLNLIGAVCNQLAGLGITLLIARELGRAQLGRYAQAYALMALLGLLSLSGLRTAMLRFVAVHRADRDPGAVRGVVRLGIALSTGASLLLATGLYLAAPWLVGVAFDDERLVVALRFVALTLPAVTLTDIALAATQGFRTMKPYALIGLMFEPLARLGLTALLLSRGLGLRGAMAALAISSAMAAVLAVVALYRLLGAPTMPTRYRLRELFRFSMVSWVASLATSGLVWADTILLGIFRPSAEVGVYNVATRLVTLATFVMPAINTSFGPRIADLYHRGQTASLRRAYAAATSWILRLSLPAFVALAVFPRDLLALFGRGFQVGAAVTIILAAGKLIDAGTGPCALMLNMSGRPLWNMIDNIAVLVLNIALNLVLIPRFGIVGSAVAWAISLGVVNLARLTQVWWMMRMLPFSAGVARGFLAGAGACVAAMLVRRWLEPPLQLPVGLAAIVVTYLALVAMQGLSADDRLVLGVMLSRLRPARRERRGRLVPGPVGGLAVAAPAPGLPELRPVPLGDGRPQRSRPPVRGRYPRPRPRLSPVRQARTLWRGAPIVLAGTLAGLAAGVTVLPSLLPNQSTYRAAVVLEIQPFTADRIVPGMDQGGWTPDTLARSTLDLDLSGEVVRALGNRAARVRATGNAPRAAWPSRLLANLEARRVPSSDRQVEIAYVDVDSGLAGAVVDSYARRFVLARRAVDRRRTATALKLLDRQARELRTGLAEWAQRVDQERAASPGGRASTITETEFKLFARRYDAKLAEIQRLREQAELRVPVTRVQLPATVRVASTPPDPRLVAAAAALLGFLVAAAVILLAEAAAPRVATVADAEAATGADLAVTVPRRSGRRGGLTPAVEGDAFGAQAEAYRRLAGTLKRRGVGGDAFVLAVMSADPGEGRSTVAVNLAHSLARAGGRGVLLVSGDLGQPSIERVYGLKPDVRGIGEHLAGLVDKIVFLLVIVRENLMLLPAGMPVRNPAELLSGPRLEGLMEDLRRFESLVVVDTPPARWAADAQSLAAAADATLIVARANHSRWRAVVELATVLRRDRVPVLGVVLVGRRQRRLARLARKAARRWADRAPAVEAVPLSRADEGRDRARSGR